MTQSEMASHRSDQAATTGETPVLRPCPFCGGAAHLIEPQPGEFMVGCSPVNPCDIYATAGPYSSAAEAAVVWNRRHNEQ